jgi:hypothetical protein
MLTFLKKLFTSKAQEPVVEAPYKVETPAAKVEAINAQPVVAKNKASDNVPLDAATKPKAPAKKRTFVKREEGGTAKVAKIKAPAKPRAPKAK